MKKKNHSLDSIVSINPQVRGGAPCFKNTRIPVSYVIKHFELGWNIDEIVNLFPELSKTKISKVLSYIEKLVTNEKQKINSLDSRRVNA